MIKKKSIEVKFELTFIGVILCLLSFDSFTQSSLYLSIESILKQILQNLKSITFFFWLKSLGIDISSTLIIYATIGGLILWLAISSISSGHPPYSRRLFYLAFLLFTPTALSFSELDWINLIAYIRGLPNFNFKLTTNVPVLNAIALATAIGCYFLLIRWYSEYGEIIDELTQRGVDIRNKAIRSSLLFGIAIILLSGFIAFSISMASLHMLNLISFLITSPLHILICLFIAIVLAFALLWYLAVGSSRFGRVNAKNESLSS
jgi:hypothetical protein